MNAFERMIAASASAAATTTVTTASAPASASASAPSGPDALAVVAAVPSASLSSSVQIPVLDVDDDYSDDEDEKAKLSCDLIRRKIQAFLGTKEMTQTEFLRIIGCNSNSFGRFMRLKGAWNGTQNGVYWGAQRFFIKREEKAKVAKASLPKADRKRKATEEAGEKAEKKLRLSSLLTSLDAIQLDNDNVYDDCDDIRKKSNEFIAAHCPSLSDWNKAIGNVESKQWDNFMGHKGAGAGAGCKSYVNAYILLEKYRIHKGAAKSAKRLRNENENPDGFPLKSDNGMRYVFQGKFGHAIVFRKFQREDQRPK